jgi:hypothetical protein
MPAILVVLPITPAGNITRFSSLIVLKTMSSDTNSKLN